MIAISRLTLLGFLVLSWGCSGRAPEPPSDRNTSGEAGSAERTAGHPAPAGPPSAPSTRAPETILFIGTSLTAGLGLDPDQAYPALIQQKIDSAGLPYRVQNAGVSGETSAGARRRTDWLFQKSPGQRRPGVLVIETGANDMLRGQSPDSAAANIQAIIDRAKALQPAPRIVLVGIQALPNFGADYARRFAAIYPRLARENGVSLVPFLLQGVAGVDSLNQADGLHPTAAGQRIAAENVWKTLEPMLERSGG